MQISWATKITILYLGFVGLILTLAFISFGHKSELEYKDYYNREINFQQQIDAAENSKQLQNPVVFKVAGKHIEISIPVELLENEIKGSVYFLCPSDASKDFTVQFSPDKSGRQIIERGLQKAAYKMQLSFSSGTKSFYKEEVISIR